MSAHSIPEDLRTEDQFHHIDPGFLNHRLCMGFLSQNDRQCFAANRATGSDHFSELSNCHLLVAMVLDRCEERGVPALFEALQLGKERHPFRSTERLTPCPEVYDAKRVCHAMESDLDFGKPVVIAYHTKHIVSDTGKMVLHQGACKNYVNSIVGILHDRADRFEIEPMVIGQPWFDHPRNGADASSLMPLGRDFGEILPEDIDQFSKMRGVVVENSNEWMNVMKRLQETEIKDAFARLLSEPTKKDWGGESNDHFSDNVTIRGQRRTAAFLLKGRSSFREMTLDMCGRRADQIHRLVDSNADVSIVQHVHLIGPVVRRTL